MKVILVKDCKDGKANQIIEVSDGYAKNFLIKNGYAIPNNSSTSHALSKTLIRNEAIAAAELARAEELKSKLESHTFSYALKVTNMVVHGSVTRKHLLADINAKGFKISQFAIDAIHINTTGTTLVSVRLHKDVVAKVKVEVKANGK